MGSNMNIASAVASDMTNAVTDYSVDSQSTDAAADQEETTWQNSRWTQQWGYFNNVPDLKSALIMKAIWNMGSGYECDPETQVILDHVSGWGKDSFDDILFNLEVVKRIGGDAYAEIIRDEDSGTIINLKPISPENMKIVVNRQGKIVRYEQTNKVKGKKPQTWEPEEILHLSNNRLADQIHGISDIDVLEKTILADEESFDDVKKIMHRQARPMIMFKLKTDDAATITAFKNKMDAATNKGENIYIPDDENTVDWEVVQVSVTDMVLAWRNETRNRFYRAIGLPQIVPGAGGQGTESESKVIYLAFENITKREQRGVELQLWNQLALRIKLIPPVTLQQNMLIDEAKDAGGMSIQQGEMNPAGGR